MKRKIYSQQKIKELDEIDLKLKRYNENLAQKLNVKPPKISNELIAENHEYRAYLLIDSCNMENISNFNGRKVKKAKENDKTS